MTPPLARIIQACAALRDVSVGELVQLTGFPTARVSQIRSGARGNLDDAYHVLRALGADPKAVITELDKVEARHPGQVDAALAALLLSFPPDEPVSTDPHAYVCCDALALGLPESVAHKCEVVIEHALKKGRPVQKASYKRAVRYRGVFIAVGLRWKDYKGVRVEFNPSEIESSGEKLVRTLVDACSSTKQISVSRVDVAVDLPVPIGWVQPLGTHAKKYTAIGTADGLQTMYVGSKKHKRSIAVYDKALESGTESPLTRFEARHKQQEWGVDDLLTLPDPFVDLRLLWLDGEHQNLADRVLTRLAMVVGWPALERGLPRKRFVRLRKRYEQRARDLAIPHPSKFFRQHWKSVAGELIERYGLKR